MSCREMDEDIPRLKATVVGLLSDLGCNGATVTSYMRSQISCSLQLITKQFVPMVGTFMFNGIDQRSQLLAL